MSNGVIESRIPADDYHSRDGISITRLKEIKRSPQHYRYLLGHPKQSAPMTLGTAAHCAVLEPERFEREFSVWTSRTAAGKMSPRSGSKWEEFCALHADRTIITADDYDDAMAMQKAIRSDTVAMKYLQAGEPEVVMQWKLHDDLKCRGRVDWLTQLDGEPVIVGLKTARDCRPFIFGSAAAKLSYHCQWAWYHDGYVTIKERIPRMIEIVVESAPPHAVVTYVIPEDVLLQGRDEYNELLMTLQRCEAEGIWPGPAETEQVLTLPSWVYQSQDDLEELGLEVA